MKKSHKSYKILNILALFCLLGGPWGLPFTGLLQIIAAIFFLISFPKDKWIYAYFLITASYLIIIKIYINFFDLRFFIIPIFLVFYLTYVLHFKKVNHEL